MRGLNTPPNLPKLRTPPRSPTGPSYLPKVTEFVSGPGEPPDGFLTGQNSATEWIAYWALFKIYGTTSDDPRQGPWYGLFPHFEYQSSELGSWTRALGSAVLDFVVFEGATLIGIRIQTERFHLFAASRIQANDSLQRAAIESNGVNIIDVYDDQLLPAGDGQKAIIAMKQAVGLLEKTSPLFGGTALRASRLKVLR